MLNQKLFLFLIFNFLKLEYKYINFCIILVVFFRWIGISFFLITSRLPFYLYFVCFLYTILFHDPLFQNKTMEKLINR